MLTHEQIWNAIDRLATTFGYSPSGLAKQSGLDSTSFNKSKRIGPDGKPRWPSTESISRILGATGATMSDFISFVDDTENNAPKAVPTIPVINFKQAESHGYFNEKGYPLGDRWDEVQFPEFNSNKNDEIYALEVKGNAMSPLYRDGNILVISPKSKMRIGDRIIIKTTDGKIIANELIKQNSSRIEIEHTNSNNDNKILSLKDISWMARIMWASQ